MNLHEFLNSPDAELSLRVLSLATEDTLSNLLNPIKVIKNDDRLPRNWEGLASLCGIGTHLLPSIESAKNQTAKLLQMWKYNNENNDATIGKLILYLERLDRTDVVDDVLPLLAKDIEKFKETSSTSLSTFTSTIGNEQSNKLLTTADSQAARLGLHLQKYDAYVLYDDDDVDFASNVIGTLEGEPYNLHLCTKEELLAGVPEHTAISNIMEHRTFSIIAILSRKFLDSEIGSFLFSVAQKISLDRPLNKIIPVLYKGDGDSYYLTLPAHISVYYKLDYRTNGKPLGGDFWGKLYSNITAQQNLERRRVPQSSSIQSRFRSAPVVQPSPAMLATGNGVSGRLVTLQSIPDIPAAASGEDTSVSSKPKNKLLTYFNSLMSRRSEQINTPMEQEERTLRTLDSAQEKPVGPQKEKKTLFSIGKKKKKKAEKKTAVAVPS
nr:myeloid differentiation primary response 88 [Anthonomus grandis]